MAVFSEGTLWLCLVRDATLNSLDDAILPSAN